MKEDKKGIYKILNLVTNDFYIGSTSISFMRRFTQHRSDLRKGKHRNIHLQRAYNRDGEDNFEYQILEEIDNNSEIQACRTRTQRPISQSALPAREHEFDHSNATTEFLCPSCPAVRGMILLRQS